jgi:hypothetical protein
VKLVGQGPSVERRTTAPREVKTPGEHGQVIPVEQIRHIQIRRNGPQTTFRIDIEGEEGMDVRVLTDSGIEEVLGAVLVGREMETIEIFTLTFKPAVMEDGATFKFAKKLKPFVAKMSIEYQSWGGTTLAADISVPPMATLEEIFSELQKNLEESLDSPDLFQIFDKDGLARPLWGCRRYRIIPKED